MRTKILIIEDNQLNLEMARDLLEVAGFETLVAEEAFTGLELAQKEHPDLILIDLHLPGLDGFEATHLLKREPDLKHIPVVAFTAMVMKTDLDRALAAGCQGYIPKPIDVKRFAQTVASFLPHSADPSPVTVPHTTQVAPLPNHSSFELPPHQVLVVDDNPMNVELLKGFLEAMGQTVHSAFSGREALAKAGEADLILLDIMMPGMDGYEVLRRLQQDDSTRNIPVILVSALDKTQNIVQGFDLGAFDYIPKPFKTQELKARITSALKMKDLQTELLRQKDTLEKIFDYSADPIVLLSEDGAILSANTRFQQAFGISQGPLKEAFDCQCPYEGVCPRHTPGASLLPNNGGPQIVFIHQKTEEGQLRTYHLHAGRIPTDRRLVVLIRDVTEQQAIAEQKETFVATLTHDLKTPIRAEYRVLELLKEGQFGPVTNDQRDLLDELIRSNRFMHRMVDSLLTTYKYEEGRVTLSKEPVNLNTLIVTTLSGDLKTLAEGKQQTLGLDLADQLPLVLADPLEIQRVISNLVQNALMYTPEQGHIEVRTLMPEPGWVQVDIIDNGRGIDPEQAATLFNRYASFAKKFRQVGTGLGFYLSKQILEAHEGTIGLESEPGQGSRFFFRLHAAPQLALSMERGNIGAELPSS